MSAQSQVETQQGPSITRATIERLIKENSKLRDALKAYTDFDSAGARERGLDECDRRAREALTQRPHTP